MFFLLGCNKKIEFGINGTGIPESEMPWQSKTNIELSKKIVKAKLKNTAEVYYRDFGDYWEVKHRKLIDSPWVYSKIYK